MRPMRMQMTQRSPSASNAAARDASRRWFLRQCGVGLGAVAAHGLLQSQAGVHSSRSAFAADATAQFAPKPPMFPAKAKRVIYLFQAGAPSQIELFDEKPELTKRNGELPPAELLKGYRAAFINPNSALLGAKYGFQSYGQSGMRMGELLPQLGSIADDLCLVRSMQTEAVNHAPAQIMMNTGSQLFGRPSFGSWMLYGLGTECQTLPGFVVLTSAKGTSGGASNYGSGFLPSMYTGTPFRSAGDPVLYLSNPPGIDESLQRASLDTLRELNGLQQSAFGDGEIAARIASFEMAFELQSSAPDLMDLGQESAETLADYGIGDRNESSFARNCLLARRLVERGVRFIQLFHEVWDQHGDLTKQVKANADATDRPSAALIKDLKQRGLLEDTLVIWGGEFGRTPMVQGGNDGRDHHNRSFSMLLAGGGVKGGYVHGTTDEFGFNVVEKPVHVHDLHATLLHLLGMDHERLTYRFQGRDFRLTDVHGKVVDELLA
jgi:hypothetical protein